MRLQILWFADPTLCFEKEGDSFVFGPAVNHMTEDQILRIYDESCLLRRFARDGLASCFIAIDMTRDNAVVSVFVARILAPQQENLVVLKQQQVSFWNESKSC